MKDYSFYNRAIKLDKKNAGKYYKKRAELYFLDMEYDKSLLDFEEAKKSGVNIDSDWTYNALKWSKCDDVSEIDKTYSKKYDSCYRTKLAYFCIKHKYSQAFELCGKHLTSWDDLYYNDFTRIYFDSKRYKFKCELELRPRYQSIYFARIKLYTENLSRFTGFRKRFFRQRINQDFDKLAKISRNPEYIFLLRAKYYEKLYEFRYAIYFCKKSLALAQNKSDTGFAYIVSSVLKDLYVKNHDFDNAYEIALKMVKSKPSPQILSKAVNSFFYIPSLFNFDFSEEFNKYKSYHLIKEISHKRSKKLQKKELQNAKNNSR